MKNKWLCTVSLLSILIFTTPGLAEFYRYKDSHGNVIYTDDLSKVPPEQRSQAEMYEESSSIPSGQDQEGKTADSAADRKPLGPEALKQEGERLLKIKEELDREYNALVKENAELKTEQESAVTPEQIKTINKKVVGYNTRFQAYHEKSAAYENDVKAYNEQTKAVEAESKSEPGTN